MSSEAPSVLVVGSEPYALALAAVAARTGDAVTLAGFEDTPALEHVRAQAGLHLAGPVKPGFASLRVVDPHGLPQAAKEADLIIIATLLRTHRQLAATLAAARSTAGVLL